MRKKLLVLLSVLISGIPLWAQETGPSRIILKFKQETALLREARGMSAKSSRGLQAFAGSRISRMRPLKSMDGTTKATGGLERIFVVDLENGADIEAAVRAFSRKAGVEYAEPDHIARATGEIKRQEAFAAAIPEDPLFGWQWSLRNTGQSVNGMPGKQGADINAVAAWNLTKGDPSIIMAILDSGISYSNEFEDRLIDGYDYVNEKVDASDDNGHGTAVASIAAATGGNSILMAGIDWKCKIMPVKVINQYGTAAYSDIASGIVFATDHGARVINISAAGYATSQILQDAVDYGYAHGAVIVASTGNDNVDTASYPASYPHVIAVGATNSSDQRANPFSVSPTAGSNFGDAIDFVAPGDYLMSLDYEDTTQGVYFSGTSVSSPLVSGAVSLLLSVDSTLSFEQIYSLLRAGAWDQVGLDSEDVPGWDRYYGWGRIDLYRSLQAAGILTIPAGGAVARSTQGTEPSTRSGYGAVTVPSANTPYGVAVFSFKQNGVVASEVGVPSSPPTRAARIFIDYRLDPGGIDINTGLAVVNRNTSKANVTYRLRNSTGDLISSATGTVEGNTHFAKFIDQLKDVAPDFSLPVNFQTEIQFGSLDITSDQPLSIVALRLTYNQNYEPLLTSTPVADLTNAPAIQPLYFPQFVDGGGYTTTLMLLNTSDADESGTISFWNEDGQPLLVRRVGDKKDSTFNYTINPGGVYVFRSDGSSAGTNPGSVHLTVTAGKTPSGAGVFSYYSPAGILVSESGIPSAVPTTSAHIYIDQSGRHDTGVVIANPGDAQITVTLRAYQTDGSTPVGDISLKTVKAKGHQAAFTYELVSGLPEDFTGVLAVTSTSPFVALTLRTLYNERDDFLMTTFPVADLNQPAPAPIVFPQIADGGGYITQCILLSTGQESIATLKLLEENGQLITVEDPNESVQ
jgi:subtilisin family serine protease